MKSIPRTLTLLALCGVSSCGPQRFFNEVHTGKIVSAPIVKWTGPNNFELVECKDTPFEFHRFNGEVIRPAPIKTDGGSIPAQAWGMHGLSPWAYAPGYLVHDWLYEANRRGKLPGGRNAAGQPIYYDRKKCDLILAEVIKTQMLDPVTRDRDDPHPTRLFIIYSAVKAFGERAYNGNPHPVDQPVIVSQVENAVGGVVPDVIKEPIKMIGLQATSPPEQPADLSGSLTPIK